MHKSLDEIEFCSDHTTAKELTAFERLKNQRIIWPL